MRTSSEIVSVKYATYVTGHPLPMNPEFMRKLCTGFAASKTAYQLLISNVDVTVECVREMSPLFSPSCKLRSLQLSDCRFVLFKYSIYIFYFI